jgi:3'(2'), 5'-bisphosphate nucleotidase
MSRDADAAAAIATEAGDALLAIRSQFGDLSAMRTAGDACAQLSIAHQLAERFPHDTVLSEEAPDDRRRLTNRRTWIIDPLDGTREFAEPPRQDWAVHIALVEGGELVAGAVALPAAGVTMSSGDALPAISPVEDPPRIAVSRTRPPEVATALAAAIGAALLPMGSAGAKAMAVVNGQADAYVHAGGQWEWDSAAPVAVASAAGLHVSRLDGSPLRYNQPNPWLPDLLICHPQLAERMIQIFCST